MFPLETYWRIGGIWAEGIWASGIWAQRIWAQEIWAQRKKYNNLDKWNLSTKKKI